jgi:RNA polymerase sigma-70 factor (ECF subfamily)
VLSGEGPSDVVETFLQRRAALVRYFTVRTGSSARAEDLVQEIYLKIASLDDRAKAEVRNPAAFLYRLGANLMLDRLKQDRRGMVRDEAWRRHQGLETAAGEASDEPAADEVLAAKQRLRQLSVAVEELTPQVRRAFVLHKLNGKSQVETAQAMNISRSAVEKHVSAALKHLMRRLE